MQLAEIKELCTVSENIHRVSLFIKERAPFLAGQYLKLWLEKDIYRPYSIASSNYENGKIDIFVGYKNQTSAAANLIENMKFKKKVYVSLPHGDAYYRFNDNEIVLIAVEGTGYAYGKSIALQSLMNNSHKKIYFIWKVNDGKSIFELIFLHKLKKEYSNFNFLISMSQEIENMQQLIALQCPLVFGKTDIYLAGSSHMMRDLKQYFCGLMYEEQHIYGDFYD